MDNISELELDLLMLYYTFADQMGRVDIIAAATYAAYNFGVLIPTIPLKLEQKHLDVLMDKEIIPDIRLLFNKICMLPDPPKKAKRKKT